MTQFFFDIASPEVVHHDFKGRSFARPEEAHEFAKLIALDLACIDDSATEVQVRNVAGNSLFLVRVGDLDLMAA